MMQIDTHHFKARHIGQAPKLPQNWKDLRVSEDLRTNFIALDITADA